jgi:UDP-N-acetyl-D-glucosamine/UDP-N-acetyl-D-galactosamine dehydrogenase
LGYGLKNLDDLQLCVVGLGYVGLPLAAEFSKLKRVIGFDINENRIKELKEGIDKTGEVGKAVLNNLPNLTLTANSEDLTLANCYIITVPTPVDDKNKPDLSYLKNSCEIVGRCLGKGDIVIIESTVYPGATEEFCAPILAKTSGLEFNEGFFCGYSPERINPGDKDRGLKDIIKVTSGSTPDTASLVDSLYRLISLAGTHKTISIKIAEAAKVIENAQRDLNIAFINEISMLFSHMNIPSKDVLEAAATKWNFLNFKPGLVGGHCIGVDPYYLTFKAQQLGFKPQTILAGRKINNDMPEFICNKVIEQLKLRGKNALNASVLVMGITFKENCPDTRNSKVFDIVNKFKSLGTDLDVFDPIVDEESVLRVHDLSLVGYPVIGKYDVIIYAVPHHTFRAMPLNKIHAFGKPEHFIFDVKHELTRGDNVLGV